MWLNWHLDITQPTKQAKAEAPSEAVASPEAPATQVPFVSVVMTHYNRPHLLKVTAAPRFACRLSNQLSKFHCSQL